MAGMWWYVVLKAQRFAITRTASSSSARNTSAIAGRVEKTYAPIAVFITGANDENH